MTRRYELKQRAQRQADTRRRILEAAVALHTERGLVATQITDIAQRAGVDRVTVYRHFPDAPSLFKACATGVHLKDATITHRKAGPARHEHLIVKLNDVLITSVSHSATADQQDFESVTLSFGKVHLEYRPQRPDGTPDTPVQFKFDLKANKAG